MITETTTLSAMLPYPLEDIASLRDFLIFDIETTGLSSNRSMLYLIGAMYYKDDSWHMIQWFADTPNAEGDVLTAFFSFAKEYRFLLHFNGSTFDLPFIKNRAKLLGISGANKLPDSIDLLTKYRPLKKLLKLSGMTLKELEQFIGCHRQDALSGKDLIPIYKDYVVTHNLAQKDLILLHNHDDLVGVLSLLPLLSYVYLLNGDFEIISLHTEEQTNTSQDIDIVFELRLFHALPKPLSSPLTYGYLTGQDDICNVLIHGTSDVLKHFFPDYKNYYYLPDEDTAIHKSVASYVDKNYRKPAKATTCYCKKKGIFLPTLDKNDFPIFRSDYGTNPMYIEYTASLKENKVALTHFLIQHLKTFF